MSGLIVPMYSKFEEFKFRQIFTIYVNFHALLKVNPDQVYISVWTNLIWFYELEIWKNKVALFLQITVYKTKNELTA